jgi:hypothetical protein
MRVVVGAVLGMIVALIVAWCVAAFISAEVVMISIDDGWLIMALALVGGLLIGGAIGWKKRRGRSAR